MLGQVYDLSVPIVDGMDWYNELGIDPVAVREVGSLERNGWRSHWLGLMVLNGTTYLETGAHLFQDAPALDDIPAQKLITRAFVVGLATESREALPPAADLGGFRSGHDSLLLHCGFDEHLASPLCYAHSPHFSKPLQQWILKHRPAILGSDALSFDHPDDEAQPFLHEFFRLGGMILCPLAGLGEIPSETVTLCAAPLRLAGANAAPCRVLAW